MVGLGVSIGDAIALSILAKDILTSLKDSTGSSEQYLGVISGLRSLELAFPQIQRCHDQLQNEAQKAELRQVVSECKKVIKDFLQGIAKYHGHLSAVGTRKNFKDALRKIQWRFCKAEDLDSFRLKLVEHRQSIQILLINYYVYVAILEPSAYMLIVTHRSSPIQEAQLGDLQQTLLSHDDTLLLLRQSMYRAQRSFNSLRSLVCRVYNSCLRNAESLLVIKELLLCVS